MMQGGSVMRSALLGACRSVHRGTCCQSLRRVFNSDIRPPGHSKRPSSWVNGAGQHFHTSLPRRSRPTAHIKPSDPLPEQVRSIMRLLTHPVVVCTSSEGDCPPRAMTMSSFTSLSLQPTPLITFNVLTPSRTLDTLSSSGDFHIHILRGDELGSALADRFTKGNDGDAVEGVAWRDKWIEDDGVLYVLRCRLAAGEDIPKEGMVRVRDHVVVVGEVVEVIPCGAGSTSEEFGLAYTDRAYRRAGEKIPRA